MQLRAAPRLNETSQTSKWEKAKPETRPISPKNKHTLGCSASWMESSEHPIRALANHGALVIPTPFIPTVDAGAPQDPAELGGMREGGRPSPRSSSSPVEQSHGMLKHLGGFGGSETAALASQKMFHQKQGSRSST